MTPSPCALICSSVLVCATPALATQSVTKPVITAETITHQALTTGEVEVYRAGGDTDHGDHIVRSGQRGFPGRLSGRMYLLLLSRNRVRGAFETRFGRTACSKSFPTAASKRQDGPRSLRRATKTAATLLEEIRQMVRNR
jgi:hypothetical protein